ncbi:MAG: CoB--CoM heterodisulfide reductase iron-sulfur subunit A family protein [Deltaproteobacteria bacterium]|nr:CoB--CoM heterodisulfide reductase iron-sulfur subunit A family protein [Deltaproteobacteria bacterium]
MARQGGHRIGVYVCHCGVNISSVVDVTEVAAQAAREGDVVVAKDYKFMCSAPGQDLIRSDIAEQKLDRVVVAACSPRMHDDTFRGACAKAGLNPYFSHMVNIREQDSWVTKDKALATQKAVALTRAAVRRVRRHEPLFSKEVDVQPGVLVIGGGIAGIQAALTVADGGQHVYLVEKEPTIGGHMARFDKTFPTLDCSACILTPKMNSVGFHPNITLLTYSEVKEVSGYIGNFKAVIETKARYVDHDVCNGCGLCMEKCPKKVASEFDEGLIQRRAIYVPFPQAVPNKPVIDRDNCTYFQNGKCKACEKVCGPKAIRWDDQPRTTEVHVGSVIVATGYEMYRGPALAELGYGRYPEVYQALEFERLNNASGPTEGKITTRDGRTPQAVAIVHCVGSRDKSYQPYCSRVCCMYSLKFAHLIQEKTGAEVWEFYIDVRSPGKAYEEFYDRIREEGTHLIRGKVGQVTDVALTDEERGKLIVVAEDTLAQQRLRVPVDMVILSPGLAAAPKSLAVAQLLKCSTDKDGFLIEKHPKLAPIETATDGVFLAGCCQGPKDIPDTVAQAQGAAAMSLQLVGKGKVLIEGRTAWTDAELCSGCRICNPLCPYGAITFDEVKKVSVVNEVLCKGCGTCAAACPSGAAQARHFNDQQIFCEIEGVLAP